MIAGFRGTDCSWSNGSVWDIALWGTQRFPNVNGQKDMTKLTVAFYNFANAPEN